MLKIEHKKTIISFDSATNKSRKFRFEYDEEKESWSRLSKSLNNNDLDNIVSVMRKDCLVSSSSSEALFSLLEEVRKASEAGESIT